MARTRQTLELFARKGFKQSSTTAETRGYPPTQVVYDVVCAGSAHGL